MCERLYAEAELSLSKEVLWRSGGALAAGPAHASGSGGDGLVKLRVHTTVTQRCHTNSRGFSGNQRCHDT